MMDNQSQPSVVDAIGRLRLRYGSMFNDDINDTLLAAADRIEELESVIRGLMRVQSPERNGMVLKEYQAARDAMKRAALPQEPGQ